MVPEEAFNLKKMDQARLAKLYQVVTEQIQHYSKTGERLYKISDVAEKAMMGVDSVRKYVKEFLNYYPLFRKLGRADVIYDMILGFVKTSYHSVKRNCEKNELKLETNPLEWFNLIKNQYFKTNDRKHSRLRGIGVLKVKVKCIKENHLYYMNIKDIKKYDYPTCRICNLIRKKEDGVYSQPRPWQVIKYEDLIKFLEGTPFELVSTRAEVKEEISGAMVMYGKSEHALFRWLHKECNYIFERSYRNFLRSFTCPKCSQSKHQRITHGFCEYVFNFPFEVEKSMKDIFEFNENPEIKKLHDAVRIDIFQKLNLKDKNGNFIKLGVRYNGEQHEDSPEGWDAYKRIARSREVEYGSRKYKFLWSKWRKLIETDKIKAEIFKKNVNKGYYLIIVNHKIKPSQMQQFIISEFESQTGIKIEMRTDINWRTLL